MNDNKRKGNLRLYIDKLYNVARQEEANVNAIGFARVMGDVYRNIEPIFMHECRKQKKFKCNEKWGDR